MVYKNSCEIYTTESVKNKFICLVNKIYFILCLIILCPKVSIGQYDILFAPLKNMPCNTDISIGFYENGEIQKIGFSVRPDSLLQTNNSDKLFELGSITKVFTTLSALKIMHKNEIGLEESITDYLNYSDKDISSKITFYKLMTHTSGIPKMPFNFVWSALRKPSDPFAYYSEQKMVKFLDGFDPKKEESFQYSNIGIGLLGHVISIIESQSLDSIMHKNIFKPINMSNTHLKLPPDKYEHCINPVAKNGKPKHMWNFSSVTQGAGSLYSNVDDILEFLKYILNGTSTDEILYSLNQKMEMEQFKINKDLGAGLGWRIYENQYSIPFHGGRTYGYKSFLSYNRQTKRGMVILTNAKGLSIKHLQTIKDLCFRFVLSQKLYEK